MNSCYLSASIQLLFSVHKQLQLIRSDAFSSVLCRTLSDLASNTRSPLYPISLLSKVRKSTGSFSQNSFQDAHEFLLFILSKSQCSKFSLTIGTSIICGSVHIPSKMTNNLSVFKPLLQATCFTACLLIFGTLKYSGNALAVLSVLCPGSHLCYCNARKSY